MIVCGKSHLLSRVRQKPSRSREGWRVYQDDCSVDVRVEKASKAQPIITFNQCTMTCHPICSQEDLTHIYPVTEAKLTPESHQTEREADNDDRHEVLLMPWKESCGEK